MSPFNSGALGPRGVPGVGPLGMGPLGPWGALGPQGGSLGRAPGGGPRVEKSVVGHLVGWDNREEV